MNMILIGDVLEQLKTLPTTSVQCVITSPPYYGLRDYGMTGQLGLERTPEEYVARMVEVFREVRRVLRDDGTLWLNLGDSYAGSGKGQWKDGEHDPKKNKTDGMKLEHGKTPDGLKPKDLIGIPWRVAFALQADGWYLRSDIIWEKPNAMPSSVKDRPSSSHEHVFLLSKSQRYFYDAEAVKEDAKTPPSRKCGKNSRANVDRVPRMNLKQDAIGKNTYVGFNERYKDNGGNVKRNLRDVWHVATKPYKGAHFAVFPEALVEPCVKASSRTGDVVLDPFAGSGTTLAVAKKFGRRYVGIELNKNYLSLIHERLK